jgi:hypothetical protein
MKKHEVTSKSTQHVNLRTELYSFRICDVSEVKVITISVRDPIKEKTCMLLKKHV